ncbi:MAG: hypothetical protein FIA91_03625 [Geobacter sp.]|nr:hypothetical protein [Geobacter sp.]
MVHIVQVVLSGSAEQPQVFSDEAAARTAYVGSAKKYWAQSYAAYCQRSGADSDSFASAQAFVASFDLAERSRLHYWSVAPEETALPGGGSLQPGLKALQEQRAHIEQLVQEVEQSSGVVRGVLHDLLATIAELTGDAGAVAVPPEGKADAPRPLAVQDTAPAAQEAEAQPVAANYNTKEWQEYVASIRNMCSNSRREYHLFTRDDWRQAVYSNQTSFEYWEWLAITIDHYIEKAQLAGYAVVPDSDRSGGYRFKTPDGIISDVSSDAEGEAWCRAGLHIEGK